MNIFELPDLPRERLLLYGADGVSTAELLAVILGTGTRGRSAKALAQHILHRVGGVTQLARATPRELVDIPGIGLARAARIAAAFDLGRRALEATLPSGDFLRDPKALYERLKLRLSGLSQEVFLVVALDARNAIVEEIEVARGCLNNVEVHPREVFRPLIRRSAAAAVVAHNHPSGELRPSDEDIDLTVRLHAVGQLIGIPVLDHVVIGASGYLSLFEVLGLR
jgi:DNA repair protein RadC